MARRMSLGSTLFPARACCAGWYSWQRLRPAFFASYVAISASWISLAGSLVTSLVTAMPMLQVTDRSGRGRRRARRSSG